MPAEIPEGTLAAWWNGRDLALGIVLGEEKRKVLLLASGGRVERVTRSRIAFPVGEGTPSLRAAADGAEERSRAVRAMETVERRVREMAARVDVGVLWELALEAGEPPQVEDLAGAALGSGSGEKIAAVIRALLADGLHFHRKGDRWEPRSPEVVEKIRLQRQRTAEREAQREAVLAFLRGVARGESPEVPEGETARRVLRALEEFAVHREDTPRPLRELAKDAVRRAEVRCDRAWEGAFRLLRAMGRFRSDDENLEIRRFGLRVEFPDEVADAARRVARHGFRRRGRIDLTELAVITVDSAVTREIDDGLSLEVLPGGARRLGVHIADPAAFLVPGDPMDAEALLRAVTHYLPDRKILMVPAPVSEGAASLLEGEDRPAVSFLVEIGSAGEVNGSEVVRSVIRSRARLDYAAVDRLVRGGEGEHASLLRALYEWAELRARRRAEAGAVRILAPEVDVRVVGDGRIVLERIPGDAPSRAIVSEAMVLAGEAAARFCVSRGVPVVYRRQAPPVTSPEAPAEGVRDPVRIRALRRALPRAETGLRPGRHHGLGLDAYVQVTSPLRRFQDLVNHRQILSALAGTDPAYDPERLQRIAATTEKAEREGRLAERACERYWKLRYLESRPDREVSAVVVEGGPRPVVLLEETLLEQVVPALAGVEAGERVTLNVVRVNPRADLLVLGSDTGSRSRGAVGTPGGAC